MNELKGVAAWRDCLNLGIIGNSGSRSGGSGCCSGNHWEEVTRDEIGRRFKMRKFLGQDKLEHASRTNDRNGVMLKTE